MNMYKLASLASLLIPAAVLPVAFIAGAGYVAAAAGASAGLLTAVFALCEADRRRPEPAPIPVRVRR